MTEENTLAHALAAQRHLQHLLGHPTSLTGEEQVRSIRFNIEALTHELHELLDTVQWKEWATYPEGSPKVDAKEYHKELVDVFTFFLNLVLAGNLTAHELLRGYFEKNTINRLRQQEKYDGGWGKHRRSTVDDQPGTITT